MRTTDRTLAIAAFLVILKVGWAIKNQPWLWWHYLWANFINFSFVVFQVGKLRLSEYEPNVLTCHRLTTLIPSRNLPCGVITVQANPVVVTNFRCHSALAQNSPHTRSQLNQWRASSSSCASTGLAP